LNDVKKQGNIFCVMPSWAKKNLGWKTQRISKAGWNKLLEKVHYFGEFLLKSIDKLWKGEKKNGSSDVAPAGWDAMGGVMV
jgi:hypothetical protein